MAKINNSDLYEALADQMGLSKTAAKAYTDFIFDKIRGSVENGDEVIIKRFGKFALGVSAPHPGRNIHTGERMIVPARTTIRFTMSRALQDQYNSADRAAEEGGAGE